MKKGFIIIAIVLVIALYVLNKVTTAKQLEFTVGAPRNVSLKGGSLTMLLPLNARNITNGSIRVKSADFDIFSAGKYLGKALVTSPILIGPAGSTVLPVNVEISYYDLISAAGSVFNLLKSGKISLTMDGLVYAEGVQLPVKQSFEFDLPKF